MATLILVKDYVKQQRKEALDRITFNTKYVNTAVKLTPEQEIELAQISAMFSRVRKPKHINY